MKPALLTLILLITALALISCGTRESDISSGTDDGTITATGQGSPAAADATGNSPVQLNDTDGGEQMPDSRAYMIARVDGLSDRLEVTVTESEYAYGVYWVIISDITTITDREGNHITPSDIRVGDTVEIYYSGQVMLSYPPQIVAHNIVLR